MIGWIGSHRIIEGAQRTHRVRRCLRLGDRESQEERDEYDEARAPHALSFGAGRRDVKHAAGRSHNQNSVGCEVGGV
jgi:hypothetical protein